MDLGSFFLILTLVVLVVLFISRPFFEDHARSSQGNLSHRDTLFPSEEQELSVLLAERERLLNAIGELDFDHSLGKIPEEDYPTQRAILVQQGADILRRLDAYQLEPVDKEAEAHLEAAIHARRVSRASPALTLETIGNGANGAGGAIPGGVNVVGYGEAEDALEVEIASRRRARQEKATGFCPQCGKPVQKSDRFCPKCGATVNP